jgi:hypothetical protein
MEKFKRARRRTSDTAKSQDGPGASCSTYPAGQGVRSDPESEEMIAVVNVFTTGWVTYYRYAQCKSVLAKLDKWLRRKLPCARHYLILRPSSRPSVIAASEKRILPGRCSSWYSSPLSQPSARRSAGEPSSVVVSSSPSRACDLARAGGYIRSLLRQLVRFRRRT